MNACERMMGKKEGKVCMVGGFPTHLRYSDWWGETAPATSLELGEGQAVVMSPEDAKALFPPLSHYNEASIKKLRERIRNKEAINPPWLDVCLNVPTDSPGMLKCVIDRSWIEDHEGRHRVEAARLEKTGKIPIILREKPSCTPPEGWGKRRWDIERDRQTKSREESRRLL